MKHLTSILASLLGLLLVVALPVTTADAQTSDVGAAVPFVDAEGNELGTITVSEISDPATDLDPDDPADVGSRYVVLTLVFEAALDQRFDIDPNDVVLQDAEGALWSRTSVSLAEDAVFPELASQALAPGSRVSGIVGFALPEAAEVARVYYQPESSRLITLADVSGIAPPAVGRVNEVVDSAGGMGQIAVLQIIDPFLNFDPNSPPETGNRYVMAWLILENASSDVFQPSSSWFVVRDDAGYLWSSTSVPRPATEEAEPTEGFVVLDLGSQELGPGDRLSRGVYFELPEDASVTGIYLRPDSNHLIAVADLSGEGSAVATPVADDDDD